MEELKQLFQDTITHICIQDYSLKQIEVWATGSRNIKRWTDIFENQYIIVAQDGNAIVGFCTLSGGHYIDLLYIHKDYQRQGIAKRLYSIIEQEAIRQGTLALTADVSITAKLFFEHVGFILKQNQVVVMGSESFANHKMIKKLDNISNHFIV